MGKVVAVETTEQLEKRFTDALQAANKNAPKPGAVAAFKQVLSDCERANVPAWRNLKTPLQSARDFAITKASDTVGVAIAEVWERQAGEMRRELGYKDAPTLEKGLIEHVVLCWLRLAILEIHYTALMSANNTLTVRAHEEKRLSETQKRYARACVTLAKVRRLAVPNVQINVAAQGGQQVNIS